MITPTCPNVEVDGYYSITSTAAALGMHRNSILNYTTRGLLKPEFRPETARKVYQGKEIIRFWRSRL
mgnify:CR=1 FL=1